MRRADHRLLVSVPTTTPCLIVTRGKFLCGTGVEVIVDVDDDDVDVCVSVVSVVDVSVDENNSVEKVSKDDVSDDEVVHASEENAVGGVPGVVLSVVVLANTSATSRTTRSARNQAESMMLSLRRSKTQCCSSVVSAAPTRTAPFAAPTAAPFGPFTAPPCPSRSIHDAPGLVYLLENGPHGHWDLGQEPTS